jgi:hypothetical protein
LTAGGSSTILKSPAESAPPTARKDVDLDTNLILDERQVSRAANPHREFVTRRIADETIIVPIVGGVGDLDAIFTLNEVASRIWTLIDAPAPTTVRAIVGDVVRAFDVDADRAERDVVEFLEQLAEAGMIRPLDEPPAKGRD